MKDVLRMAWILGLVTVLAAGVLGAVNHVTKPRIEEQRRLALEQALLTALPKAHPRAIVPVRQGEEIVYYIGYANPDTTDLVGYAFVARGTGYSSEIETLVGVDSTGRIIGLKILRELETPGLGTKIEEIRYGESDPWFQRQFVGKGARQLAVDKDGGEIVSVTGATISSRAVTNSIRKGLEELEKRLGGFRQPQAPAAN
ncbi:MAG: RnfABCDGE type electron transport complex subunit G [candidate division KSB1 bacterium]|nr:RnfABCDGE type electron transport complex subunit G [candidate division KSB1 bacterium]